MRKKNIHTCSYFDLSCEIQFFLDDDETFQIISLLLEREQFWSFQARHQKTLKFMFSKKVIQI